MGGCHIRGLPRHEKPHQGGILIGKGAVYYAPSKQKLNTKILAESDLVGVYKLMPQILWMQYFLEDQGFKMSDNIAYQDNQSYTFF